MSSLFSTRHGFFGFVAVAIVVSAGVLAGFAATVSSLGTAVAASSAKEPTQMYRGTENVGSIEPGQIGQYRAEAWTIRCDAAESEFLTRARSLRQRARINLHFWDAAVVAYSRLETARRWVMYRYIHGNPANPSKVAGFAVRRTRTRWDVYRSQRDGWDVLTDAQRKIGHTIGPDGPPAAIALLIVC